MRPQRQPLVGDVAQGQVELGMKVIQVRGIGGLERDAFAPDAGDRARVENRSPRRDMPGKRQVDGGLDLAALDAQGGCSSHGRGLRAV